MYTLVITINHHYWKCDHECHCTRQVEKEVLESHFQKQEKASTSGSATASQNKTNPSPAALSAKISFFKLSLYPAPKKQSNSSQVDLSSKLANNGKLTSDKHKKCLENNLYLYCGTGDYKLDSYSKKQTTVTPKGCNALVTASKKPLKK